MIDIDKIEKIRQEIERRKMEWEALIEKDNAVNPECVKGIIYEDMNILSFIDSLEDERTDYTNFTQKEVHSQGYDEAYLNDCIAKAKKSWEGVDVDKYMDMVRGREPVSEELEEVELEAETEMQWDSFNKHSADYGEESEEVIWMNRFSFEDLARHFYELGLKSKKEKQI